MERRWRSVGCDTFLFIAMVVMIASSASASAASLQDGLPAVAVGLGLLTELFGVAAVRALRIGVSVDTTGIRNRGFMRTKLIAWNEVADVIQPSAPAPLTMGAPAGSREGEPRAN